MKIGIGLGNSGNPQLDGQRAAQMAFETAGIDRPALVMAFAGGQTNPELVFSGIHSVAGDAVPIMGGSAAGVITNDDLCQEGTPVAVAAFQSEDLKIDYHWSGNIDQDAYHSSRTMGSSLVSGSKDRLLLLFYDSIHTPLSEQAPPLLNASPPITKGVQDGFTSSVPIIGAGLVSGLEFAPTFQFCGTCVAQQSVQGILMGGDFDVDYRIMHGCMPKDGIYHTITRIEGPVVYEIDGMPAVEMINAMYGDEAWQSQVPIQRVALGINHGDRFGVYEEKNYVNRLITCVLPNQEGILLFEPDLENGQEIQFMLRDADKMIASVKDNAKALLAELDEADREPLLGLYIDCAGRSAKACDALSEEAAEVQKVLNQARIPLLGFYSGVEIAPFFGMSRGLDWTGVLVILSKAR
jgi:hypothetical protein